MLSLLYASMEPLITAGSSTATYTKKDNFDVKASAKIEMQKHLPKTLRLKQNAQRAYCVPVQVISLFFASQIFPSTRTLQDFTYHCKTTRFSDSQMVFFSLDVKLSFSNSFGSALEKSASFCRFNALRRKQKWRTWTTAGAPSRGWPMTDRCGRASLLPYMPAGVMGSNDWMNALCSNSSWTSNDVALLKINFTLSHRCNICMWITCCYCSRKLVKAHVFSFFCFGDC